MDDAIHIEDRRHLDVCRRYCRDGPGARDDRGRPRPRDCPRDCASACGLSYPARRSEPVFRRVGRTVGRQHQDPKARRDRVTAHPRTDWRTDVLAAEAGVSQRSLSRLFRAGLNVSPADFVERVRIDLARRRLLDRTRTWRPSRSAAALARCAAWTAHSPARLPPRPPSSDPASRPMENSHAALQRRLCHLPRSDATRLHGPAAGPRAPSRVRDAHRGQDRQLRCRAIAGSVSCQRTRLRTVRPSI